jgi:hypothetical protein
MEGSWLSEDGGAPVTINGRKWPSIISTSYFRDDFASPPPLPPGFKWDRVKISSKLQQVERTTKLTPPYNQWRAIYGRLETSLPRRIRLGARLVITDGFGHQSASPVQLVGPENGFLKLD